MRTDDELSELEECIDSELREAAAKGFAPAVDRGHSSCALSVIGRNRGFGGNFWTPGGESLGLNADERVSFAWGFDGATSEPDFPETIHAMGARFRERVLAGEYTVTGATR